MNDRGARSNRRSSRRGSGPRVRERRAALTGSGTSDRKPPLDLEALRANLARRRPGESIWVPKSEMPTLPPEFHKTALGTPRWIAQPGAQAQYRSTPALHAYEMSTGWKIHRDRFDPERHPLGHVLLDAPEVAVAGIVATVVGVATDLVLSLAERLRRRDQRDPWRAALAAFDLASLVGTLVYVILALMRVTLRIG